MAMSDIDLTPPKKSIKCPPPGAIFFYEYSLASICYHHPKLPISGELLTPPLFIRPPTTRDGRVHIVSTIA